MAYLYGASIQGIQGFIFETNRLKDIVGASNLMEKFDSEDFLKDFLKKYKADIKFDDINILRNAGANIRISFSDAQEEIVKYFVSNFPKHIMQKAYGITITQAVEIYTDNYLDASQKLELSLKNARNKVSYPLDAKFTLMKQAPRSGKPATDSISYSGKPKDNESVDKATFQKFSEAIPAHKNLLLQKIGIEEKDYKKFPFRFDFMSNSKNKLAVIHADGNKMGVLLQQMAENFKTQNTKAEDIQKTFKDFSQAIVKSTNDAVKEAFELEFNLTDYANNDNEKVPFRPLIIGGDDLTVVCDADKAIAFIGVYMKAFQKNTKNNLKDIVLKYKLLAFEDGLTACAGIAYCNEKFPFHYAVDVAEALCGMAKKASDREASCLLFHNIQGSAFTNFDKYIDNELTIGNTKLLYGPYYIREEDNKIPQLDTLLKVYDAFTQSNFPTGKLRDWLSKLHVSKEQSNNYLNRLEYITRNDQKIDTNPIEEALKNLDEKLSLSNFIVNNKTPIHDILQLKSVQGGK